MPGLSTYPASERVLSANVGYAVLQAGVQGFLTNTLVVNATSAQDLIDDVNAAVVAPGAEARAQRDRIVEAIGRGKALGDFSDARVAAATSLSDLAAKTWVTNDPNYTNGHLGVAPLQA